MELNQAHAIRQRIALKDQEIANLIKEVKQSFEQGGQLMTSIQLYKLCEKLLMLSEEMVAQGTMKNDLLEKLITSLTLEMN